MLYLVLPCYDEQEANKQLKVLMTRIPLESKVLYVDDVSAEGTWSTIQSLQQENLSFVPCVRLTHNVDHQSALWARMEASIKDAKAILIIDADFQDSAKRYEYQEIKGTSIIMMYNNSGKIRCIDQIVINN